MRRVVTLRFWRHTGWKLAGVAIVVGSLFAATLIWRGSQTCRSVNALDDALIGSLDRSELGLPSNPYFKTHPLQLQAQLDELKNTRDDLLAARC